MMIKCSICKKNIAVVFITKIINGKQIQQGLCISCAKKQGIKPINDILEQTGLSEEDLDKMNSDIMDKMMEGMDIEEMDELGESIGDFADISSRQNDEAPNPIMSLFNRFFPNPKSDQDDDKDNYDPEATFCPGLWMPTVISECGKTESAKKEPTETKRRIR
jgi:hypothetical protein